MSDMGTFGRRGISRACAINGSEAPQARCPGILSQAVYFLTADWKRITATAVVAIIALPFVVYNVNEFLKSPEQKAADAAQFRQMVLEVKTEIAKRDEAEAKAKKELPRVAAIPDLKDPRFALRNRIRVHQDRGSSDEQDASTHR